MLFILLKKIRHYSNQLRMILLMGMKSNLTTYPIPPIIANPIAQDVAIFLN